MLGLLIISASTSEDLENGLLNYMGMKVFRINPEFRIMRLTFHGKSASKCEFGRF